MGRILDVIREIPDVKMTCQIFEADKEGKIIDRSPLFNGGEQAIINVKFERVNKSNCLQANIKKLKKRKNFSWFLIVGNLKDNRIFGIRKFAFNKQITKQICFTLPKNLRTLETIDVVLMSDSFIGIDQIHAIQLKDIMDNCEYVRRDLN